MIMLECFKIIKERLEERGYGKIQYLPSRKSLVVGKELYVFRSFFYHSGPSIFHSTCFYGLYHFIFRKRYPDVYMLYKIFFMDEPAEKDELLKIFDESEVNEFIKNKIIKCEDAKCRFDFRFVPFERLFLAGKCDIKDAHYVHLNYDSVTFVEFLRKMGLDKKRYKRAVEIGCGAGLVSMEISRITDSAEAVDINPYALELMEINAKLNNISNVRAYYSDCYQNAKGRYGLIVSDPPFELMPENEKNVLHRYGGHLGMEIALKIFSGFEEHLEFDGEAVVFTNSYIRNYRDDTLKEAVRDMFKNKKFKVTFHTLSYQVNPDFYAMYRKHNISYSIAYVIHVKRSDRFEMDIVPLSFSGKIKEAIRVLYLHVVALLKSK